VGVDRVWQFRNLIVEEGRRPIRNLSFENHTHGYTPRLGLACTQKMFPQLAVCHVPNPQTDASDMAMLGYDLEHDLS
jgi:hypothetical protein